MLFAGKTAIVTGSASGIGRAISKKLLDHGAKTVYAVDLNEYFDLNSENAFKMTCNVGSRSSCDELFAKIRENQENCPDLLVNCAGITQDSQFLKMTDKQWDTVMDIDLKSIFMLSQNFGKWSKEEAIKNTGKNLSNRSIVNISSIVGKTGNYGQANYSAAKAGVIGFTKTVAKELVPLNIRVNAVLPGFIETPIVGTIPEKVIKQTVRMIPMAKMGTPEDIANTVLHLGSDLSLYTTGTAVEVAGGLELDGDNENFHRFAKALEEHGLNPKKQMIITDCLQDLKNPFWGQAFISSKNELYLCGNTVWKSFITSDRKKLQQILIHNLVHLYDKEVLNFDLYTTEDLACSKIRAYSFSNECRGDRRCIFENTKADMKVSIERCSKLSNFLFHGD